MTQPLRVVPLGGLGEIGLNCLVLQFGDAAIAVDCGQMFPDASMLGVDAVIPDLEHLHTLGANFLGFVITHGHEDHIGALPYVLEKLRVPVYAPPLAAEFIRQRLSEHKVDASGLRVFRPGEQWEMGPFVVRPIHMTHSIVDAVALAVTTPVGVVVHTGDFKIDHTPVDGRGPDLQALAELGARGVLLLLSDSTNADRQGTTPSEREVRPGLEEAFRASERRVFFSTFSSHIHRLQQVFDLSSQTGRRVAVVGRSFESTVHVAADLGYLRFPASLLVDVGEAATLDPRRLTVLASGCQGEPMSALARIAMADHPHVRMEAGDTVILSSRIIPGNERTINNMINHIARRGATTYHAQKRGVHVSGHASRDELALVLNLVRPRYFVPVHGEYRHLAAHCSLAREIGLSERQVFLLENGQVLQLGHPEGPSLLGPVRSGRVLVDGKGIGDVDDVVLRDRRHLAQDGILVVVLAVDQTSGELIGDPDLLVRGVVEDEEAARLGREARSVVRETLAAIAPESRTDSQEVQEEVRKALRRYARKTLGRRPVVLPVVMEL